MTNRNYGEPANPPPSYFAALGNPSCSRWGKSEIEWIALAYVRALANDGDTWKRLSAERVVALLTEEQKRSLHGMLVDPSEFCKDWFDMVATQLKDSAGAFGVGGFWNRNRILR